MRRLHALLCASLLAAFAPSVAHAHGRLKSSLPAAGAALTAVPRELRLDFSESPDLTFSSIRLVSAGGREIPLARIAYAADSRRSLTVAIAAALEAGRYTVVWQMAGDDGHVLRGKFDFTVAVGASGLGATPAGVAPANAAAKTADSTGMSAMHHDPVNMPESDGFGAESPGFVLVRWLQFIGILLSIGVVMFHAVVLASLRGSSQESPQGNKASRLDAIEERVAWIGCLAAVFLAATLPLRLGAQAYAMHGAAVRSHPALVLPMLGRTMWGWGWLLQLAGVVLTGAGFHGARNARGTLRGRAMPTVLGHWHFWWWLTVVGSVMLAFSSGISSHAASSPKLRLLAMLSDGVHVYAASSWLGTLAVMLLAGVFVATNARWASNGEVVCDMINAFSPLALVSAGIAAASGMFAAWLHVGTISNLWGTRYGLILLTKVGVLGVVTVTGFYNWRFVKPRLGTPEAAIRLRRSARVEVAVALVVLLITAVLVATPTSMDMTM